MNGIFRTILWSIGVVAVSFILAWCIRHYPMQWMVSDAGRMSTPTEKEAISGQERDWPQFHGDQTQSGFVSGRLPDQLTLAWRFKTEGGIKSSPAIVDGRVYIGSMDGRIYALDASNGKQVWSTTLDDEVEASPSVIDGAVYIGSLSGTLYALDAQTGSIRWTFRTGDKLVGGANWFNDSKGRLRILAGSYDASVYCIDAETGESLWSYETDNFVNGSPAVSGEYCVFGGCDAVIHILKITDGSKMGEIETGAYIAGSAAIRGDYVYIGNYDGDVLKASLVDHEVAWRYTIDGESVVSTPAVTDDVVIIGGGDMRVHCVDNRTGKVRWAFACLGAVDSSPAIIGNKVVVGSNDGRLYLLRLTDGGNLWSFETGQSIASSPAVARGMVVVGCDDGKVYCFK